MSLLSYLLPFVLGAALLPGLHAADVGIGFLQRRGLKRTLRRLTRGHLGLTYDDGPGERLQRRLLETLTSQQAHATFYLLGLRAEGREDRVQELARHGHEIGSHAFAHLDALTAAAWSVRADFDRSQRVFKALGMRPASFRPPHGRLTWSTHRRIRAAGMTVAMWTHDSGDTYGQRPQVSEIVDRVERDGGGVVLLHSHDRTGAGDSEDFVIEVTTALLRMAKRTGLRVSRYCDLLAPPRQQP